MISLTIFVMIKLTDYLYDLIQNSIHAHAETITLSLMFDRNFLYLKLIDNGIGMDFQTLKKVRLFSHTSNDKRSIGLGLSMINDLCHQTNGSFHIDSEYQKGTKLKLSFEYKHIDFPEFGDLGILISDLYMHQELKAFKLIYKKYHKTISYDLNQKFLNQERLFNIKKDIEKDINETIKEVEGCL